MDSQEGDNGEGWVGSSDSSTSKPDDLTKIPQNLWSPALRKSSAGYYFMVAETMSLREQDPRKALELYQAAYNLDPNPFLGGKMLVAKALAGQQAEALFEAQKMTLLYPTSPHLRLFYGELLAQSGDLNKAAEQLEKCIDLNPELENAYLLLTQVYQNQKETAKAIVVANDLVKRLPGSVAGWSQLSRLYLMSQRYKESLIPAKRAWEMQSTNPQLTQIYAITLQLNNQTAQAIRMYEQLYQMDPSDEELTARMVELYRELGNLESALSLLQEMEAKDTTQRRPVLQMQRAILLWELKRNQEAQTLLESVMQRYPDSDRVRYLAGFAAQRTGQLGRAIEIYRTVPSNSSLKIEAEMRILLILQELKKWELVLEQLGKIREMPQLSWEGYGILAGIYGDMGRYRDGLEMAQLGFEKNPTKFRLLFLKGVYQEKLGDINECIKTMKEVIAKDPTNSSALNFLGYLYADRGENLDQAEQLILKALKFKPNDGFYLDSLGWVYFRKGDLQKAFQLTEQAAKLEPMEGAIIEHLGDIKLKMGDTPAAVVYFNNALKVKLDPKEKKRILEKLKKLGVTHGS
jgi:tetratricopeptide (TPR) repeat protein